MTIEEMKAKKKELGYTYEQISTLSGVPLGTVQKIFNGVTSSPRYQTLQALGRVFSGSDAAASVQPTAAPAQPKTASDQTETSYTYEPKLSYTQETGSEYKNLSKSICAHEAQPAYGVKQQGDYTLADYKNLPDDTRAELIDGSLFVMDAPSAIHQMISGLLYAELIFYVRSHGGDCLPMISPLDVQLDCDETTMLQPDVLIVCNRDQVIQHCVYGAPDFIAEVLSPSTRKKDSYLKLTKYQNAGVREYWLIDPDKKRIIVYDLAHDDYPFLYGFEDKIPVRIWGDSCLIDFKTIYEQIRFLYERNDD